MKSELVIDVVEGLGRLARADWEAFEELVTWARATCRREEARGKGKRKLPPMPLQRIRQDVYCQEDRIGRLAIELTRLRRVQTPPHKRGAKSGGKASPRGRRGR